MLSKQSMKIRRTLVKKFICGARLETGKILGRCLERLVFRFDRNCVRSMDVSTELRINITNFTHN